MSYFDKPYVPPVEDCNQGYKCGVVTHHQGTVCRLRKQSSGRVLPSRSSLTVSAESTIVRASDMDWGSVSAGVSEVLHLVSQDDEDYTVGPLTQDLGAPVNQEMFLDGMCWLLADAIACCDDEWEIRMNDDDHVVVGKGSMVLDIQGLRPDTSEEFYVPEKELVNEYIEEWDPLAIAAHTKAIALKLLAQTS